MAKLTLKELNEVIKDVRKDIEILRMRHYNSGTRSEKIKCTKEIKKLEEMYNKLKAQQREVWKAA